MRETETQRGNPDADELVHLRRHVRGPGPEFKVRALCNNGAYNIRWTQFKKNVTCPKCRQLEGLKPL